MSISSTPSVRPAGITKTSIVSQLAPRSPALRHEDSLNLLYASAATQASLLSRIFSGIKEKLRQFLAWLFPSRFAPPAIRVTKPDGESTKKEPSPPQESPPASTKGENRPTPKLVEPSLPPSPDQPMPPVKPPQQKPIDPPAQPIDTKSILETGLHEFIQIRAIVALFETVTMKKESEQDGVLIAHFSIEKWGMKASLRLTHLLEQEYELALFDRQGGIVAVAPLLWDKTPYFDNKMSFVFRTEAEGGALLQGLLTSKEFYTESNLS